MSDECLFDLFFGNPSFQKSVREVDGVGLKPTKGHLEHDERPAYLKPPSKDKNTPMKRKADEGGVKSRVPTGLALWQHIGMGLHCYQQCGLIPLPQLPFEGGVYARDVGVLLHFLMRIFCINRLTSPCIVKLLSKVQTSSQLQPPHSTAYVL
ncbi:hypothetical protein SeMB42_g00734 [Synchytrium endobioticum]|uniref:Uncharacterized protein n=1 Tax=Synchytrium endobioticum TaxID=286115 RepID=A0A507DRB0_9FUNG|nr:hypothetical protein SeMB42_g00734 [Synchytrium endobioticum]